MGRIGSFARLTALLAAGVLAGCGGGSGGADTGALTKAEFIKQADAICATVNRKVEAGVKDLGESPSTDEIQKYVDDISIPQVQRQIDEIGALTPPAGDEAAVQKILDGWAEANGASKDLPPSDPFKEVDALSRAYGFKECSHG